MMKKCLTPLFQYVVVAFFRRAFREVKESDDYL